MKPFSLRHLLLAVTLAVLGTFATSSAQAPAPFVNNPLVPDSTAPGAGSFDLTVNGTGFVSTSTVLWNGSGRSTTFVSSSQLVARINSTDVTTAGTATVTVSTPHPGGGRSNPAFFVVTNPSTTVSFKTSAGGSSSLALALASADFNDDGIPDVALLSSSTGAVQIFLGKGNGQFQKGNSYGAFHTPTQIITGDFNGDGKVDLAMTGINASGIPGVLVRLGAGDGTFGGNRTTNLSTKPTALAAGDFNGDGNLDLAAALPNSNQIQILLGSGTGTFTSRAIYAVGMHPTSVTAGDFNGDGKLDLACAANGSSSVDVLLGNGNGTFQRPVNYAIGQGASPSAVTTADVNGDGRPDLIAAGVGAISVLLGKGDGTFEGAVQYFGLSSTGQAVAVADFNGDNIPDVVATVNSAGVIGVFLGNGDGTCQSVTEWPAGSLPLGAAIGDFNRDGRLDVAVANDAATGGFTVTIQTPPEN